MNDRMIKALHRQPTDRRPLWIMRQAGRYLPEYRALRKENTFEQLCANPELAADVTMMPIERFPLDGAVIFADLMSPLAAMGVDFHFDPGPIVERPVRTPKDVEALLVPDDPASIAPEVLETLRIVRQRLDGRAALLGFAGAPWSLAAYLVEGRGSKEFPTLRAMAYREPELLDELLGKLATVVGRYLREQVKAGAQAVQLFDTWAGLLSRDLWLRAIKPHIETILAAVADAGVPRILFAKGVPHLIDDYAALDCECVAVDWLVDLPSFYRRVHDRRAVQGNIDPGILLAGPEATRAAAIELLARVPARGHIVNLGHGIYPGVPIESVQALVDVVHGENA